MDAGAEGLKGQGMLDPQEGSGSGLGTNNVGRTTWLQVQKNFLAPKVWGRNYTQPLALSLTCPSNAVDSDREKGSKGNPWPVGSER